MSPEIKCNLPHAICSKTAPDKHHFRQNMNIFTRFFYKQFFSAQAQMLLSEIQNSLKLALPYLTKRCLKYYLGRKQSFY